MNLRVTVAILLLADHRALTCIGCYTPEAITSGRKQAHRQADRENLSR